MGSVLLSAAIAAATGLAAIARGETAPAVREVVLRDARAWPSSREWNDGDTLRVCNRDSVQHRLLSFSAYNTFRSGTIERGQCWELALRNPAGRPVRFRLSSEWTNFVSLQAIVNPRNPDGRIACGPMRAPDVEAVDGEPKCTCRRGGTAGEEFAAASEFCDPVFRTVEDIDREIERRVRENRAVWRPAGLELRGICRREAGETKAGRGVLSWDTNYHRPRAAGAFEFTFLAEYLSYDVSDQAPAPIDLDKAGPPARRPLSRSRMNIAVTGADGGIKRHGSLPIRIAGTFESLHWEEGGGTGNQITFDLIGDGVRIAPGYGAFTLGWYKRSLDTESFTVTPTRPHGTVRLILRVYNLDCVAIWSWERQPDADPPRAALRPPRRRAAKICPLEPGPPQEVFHSRSLGTIGAASAGHVEDVHGHACIVYRGEGTQAELRKGMTLGVGDAVITGKDAGARLALGRGSLRSGAAQEILLGPNTELRIPFVKAGERTRLDLLRGAIRALLEKTGLYAGTITAANVAFAGSQGTAYIMTRDPESGAVDLLVTDGAMALLGPDRAVEVRAGQMVRVENAKTGDVRTTPGELLERRIRETGGVSK
jgi:hypothetical protein